MRVSHFDETVHRVCSQHLEVHELPNVKRIREDSQIVANHFLGIVGLNVVRHEKSTGGNHGTKIRVYYMKTIKIQVHTYKIVEV